jgi:hypothetical protein
MGRDPNNVLVTVEILKGSRNKYEYDEELGLFRLDRMLFSSVHYPTEYGFARGAWGEDGDPRWAIPDARSGGHRPQGSLRTGERSPVELDGEA